MSAVRARHRPPFLPAPTVRTGPCLAGNRPLRRKTWRRDRSADERAASSAWRLVPVLSKMSLSLVCAVSKEMLSAAAAAREAPRPCQSARRAAPPTGSARKPCTASPRPPACPGLIDIVDRKHDTRKPEKNRAPRPRPGGRIDGMKAAIADVEAVAQQAHERRVHVEHLPEGVKSAGASPWLKVSRLGGS